MNKFDEIENLLSYVRANLVKEDLWEDYKKLQKASQYLQELKEEYQMTVDDNDAITSRLRVK